MVVPNLTWCLPPVVVTQSEIHLWNPWHAVERLKLADLLLIAPNKHADRRGFFSETYRSDVLASAGVRSRIRSRQSRLFGGTRRVAGLHFQIPPRAQGKLVRCTRGAILDVAVDIRNGSPTFGHHVAVELSAENWKQLWVPLALRMAI